MLEFEDTASRLGIPAKNRAILWASVNKENRQVPAAPNFQLEHRFLRGLGVTETIAGINHSTASADAGYEQREFFFF